MAIRLLTYALAAAAMAPGAIAQAAAPVSVPVRSGAPVEETEGLGGGSGLLPVAIFALAVLAIMLFHDDGDDAPVSP